MNTIALVGVGYIGKLHANVIRNNFPEARIAAIVEEVEPKGRAFAAECGAQYCASLAEALALPEIDTVAICTPTFLHEEMVFEAVNRGKRIFCEKPLAVSVRQADRMVAAVRKSGTVALCGHVLRFWPVYMRARDIVAGGSLGKPLFGYCERLLTMPRYTEKAWNSMEKNGGGVALDVQIHDLDFLSWVMGEAAAVESRGIYDPAMGGWSHISTMVTYRGGGRGLVQAGWKFPEDFPFTMGFRILCERGAVEWSFRAGKLLEQRDVPSFLSIYREGGSVQNEPIDKTDAFLLEWKYFLNCVQKGTPIQKGSFEDGREALRLALATAESARSGRPVRL
jgi:predicted dehydrogenase